MLHNRKKYWLIWRIRQNKFSIFSRLSTASLFSFPFLFFFYFFWQTQLCFFFLLTHWFQITCMFQHFAPLKIGDMNECIELTSRNYVELRSFDRVLDVFETLNVFAFTALKLYLWFRKIEAKLKILRSQKCAYVPNAVKSRK